MQGRIVGWVLAQVAAAAATAGLANAAKAGKLGELAAKLDDVAFLRENPKLLAAVKRALERANAVLAKAPGAAGKAPSNLARGCFVAGTRVHTEHGRRRIEAVETGVQAWAYDRQSRTWQLRRVGAQLVHSYDGDIVSITFGGEQIEATGNHPFWVTRGDALGDRPVAQDVQRVESGGAQDGRWVDARHLRVNDELLAYGGRSVRVDALAANHRVVAAYNIEVDELHTYAVGTIGVLVHNKAALSAFEAAKEAYVAIPTAEKRIITSVLNGHIPRSNFDALPEATKRAAIEYYKQVAAGPASKAADVADAASRLNKARVMFLNHLTDKAPGPIGNFK